MNNPCIQFIITGGTIDKDYETTTGELIFTETYLPELIQQANCTLNIEFQTLMLKDSLEMNSEDRAKIGIACVNSKNDLIVITHGTDTMTDTAQSLQLIDALKDKTIVLTGAMRPFKLGNSDSAFNVGSTLTAVQLLPKGIYISMNGKVFKADDVIKNRKKGIFENT